MLKISDQYTSILDCVLCSNEGFTSQIRNCVFTAYFCYLENKFLIINDSRFVHGKWDDFYEPIYPKDLENDLKSKFSSESFYLVPKYSFLQNYDYNKTLEKPYYLPESRLFENYKVLMNDMLAYTPKTRDAIANMKSTLAIPKPFNALHIRRGDRDHGKCQSNQVYLDYMMAKTPHIQHVFLMTDDWAVVNDVKPFFEQRGIQIYTLCTPNMDGHRSHAFNQRQDKYEAIVQLLTEIEIAADSFYFVGMGYSCVSWMIIEKHKFPQNCYLVKYNHNQGVWGPDVILNNHPKVYILGGYFDRNMP